VERESEDLSKAKSSREKLKNKFGKYKKASYLCSPKTNGKNEAGDRRSKQKNESLDHQTKRGEIDIKGEPRGKPIKFFREIDHVA